MYRAILPVADELLVDITSDYNIWRFRDTNGDGKAEEKVIKYILSAKEAYFSVLQKVVLLTK